MGPLLRRRKAKRQRGPKKVKNGNYPAKSSRATITAPEFKEELEKGSHKIKAKAKGVTYKLEYAKASFNLKENSLENADVSGSYTFCEIIPWQGSVDADADKIATWDTSEIIKDGNYILRLYVNDDTGCTLTDNLRVAVNNDYFGITSPQDNAIMSAKNKIKIKGNANGSSCSSYEVAYSTDKCNWTTIKTSNTSVTNGTLATWDVPALNLSGIKNTTSSLRQPTQTQSIPQPQKTCILTPI